MSTPSAWMRRGSLPSWQGAWGAADPDPPKATPVSEALLPGGWRVRYVILAFARWTEEPDLGDFERHGASNLTLDVCAPLPAPFWTTRR
jgi:hypothetical protein